MSRQQRQSLDEMLRHGPLDLGGDVAEQRALFHDMMTSIPLPPDVSTTAGELGGVPVVTVETPASDPATVLLYLHGGAYAIGSAADAAGLAAEISWRTGARAVCVEYPLAPEHPFPRRSTRPWPSIGPCSTTEFPVPPSPSSASPRAAVSSSRRWSLSRTRSCPSPRRPRSSPRGPT